MKSDIYNKKGEKTGAVDLPESVFGVRWNADLVHQVVYGMLSNAREGNPKAHAKDRSEVSGGGKKPWRQKGTGRARHGSSRSPIWIGGGVTHGPRKDKNYGKKINKKMRTQALYAVLSKKLKDGEIIFIDTLAFDAPKTADAKATLSSFAKVKGFEKFGGKKNNIALISLGPTSEAGIGQNGKPNPKASDADARVKKSFRNIGTVKVGSLKNLNPVDALSYTYLVITNPPESIAFLEGRSTTK